MVWVSKHKEYINNAYNHIIHIMNNIQKHVLLIKITSMKIVEEIVPTAMLDVLNFISVSRPPITGPLLVNWIQLGK